MKKYSRLEKFIAQFLESSPQIRNALKWVYHRLNYLIYRERGFTYSLHEGVRLSLPFHSAADAESKPGKAKPLFFGYYDKSPWSKNMSLYLCHRTDGQEIQLLLFGNGQGEGEEMGRSSAWNWQQGSMLQWQSMGDTSRIIFNDISDRRLISRVVDTESGDSRELPYPIQVLRPDGAYALSLNYRKLDVLRPDYGYGKELENFTADQPYEEDGIWQMNVQSGETELLISMNELLNSNKRVEMEGAKHIVNHCYYSPGGTKFLFLHRWTGSKGKFSRLYVYNTKKEELRLLLDHRMVSHFCWKDETTILVWGRTEEDGDGYYLIDVESGELNIFANGELNRYGDGHPTFSPDGNWLITDTYPDKARQRHLILYDLTHREVIELGRFFAPWEFEGVKRCDLHPRWSPDGNWISIDSAHTGTRLNYQINISSITGASE